jgi:DnaJ-domain-containing protein 1
MPLACSSSAMPRTVAAEEAAKRAQQLSSGGLGVERPLRRIGGAPDADYEVIKAAFRALAKKYHPDTAADPMAAKARFPEINEAHSVLSNPEARDDRLLSAQREDPFVSKIAG